MTIEEVVNKPPFYLSDNELEHIENALISAQNFERLKIGISPFSDISHSDSVKAMEEAGHSIEQYKEIQIRVANEREMRKIDENR